MERVEMLAARLSLIAETTAQQGEERKMSRVSFSTQAHNVVAGWDRPLAEFFMSVVSRDDEDDEPVWSSIYEFSTLERQTTDRLKKVLGTLGIEAPEEFWERVELRESNVAHFHSDKGWNRYEF